MTQPAHRRPSYRITLNGRDLTPTLDSRLQSLTLTDNRMGEVDQLDLVLDDTDGGLELPRRGVEIQVFLGWEDEGLVDKGRFIVDEVEHSGPPDLLSIRARSADLRKSLTIRHERSWHRTTVGAIITKLARENELKPLVAASLAKKPVPHMDQTSESDLSFLTRLGRQFDALATVKNGALLFLPLGASLSASGSPLPVAHIERADGDRHRFCVADGWSYKAVVATWQDSKGAKKGEVLVELGKNGYRELGKGAKPDSQSTKVLRHQYATKANAVRAAKSELARIQRSAATFHINLAQGQGELTTEQPATLTGWKPGIDGASWLISKVTHQLDDNGYTSQLEMELRLPKDGNAEPVDIEEGGEAVTEAGDE